MMVSEKRRKMESAKIDKVRKELNGLLNNGVRITIDRKVASRKWLGKRECHTEKTVYELQQPVLAALDLINYYVQDIAVDETRISGAENPYPELRRVSVATIDKIAHAMAVAILNREAFVKTKFGYRKDEKRIEALTKELLHNVTPGKLFEMSQALAVMCNLSDFLNSIRLMQVAPDRIEPTEG